MEFKINGRKINFTAKRIPEYYKQDEVEMSSDKRSINFNFIIDATSIEKDALNVHLHMLFDEEENKGGK